MILIVVLAYWLAAHEGDWCGGRQSPSPIGMCQDSRALTPPRVEPQAESTPARVGWPPGARAPAWDHAHRPGGVYD